MPINALVAVTGTPLQVRPSPLIVLSSFSSFQASSSSAVPPLTCAISTRPCTCGKTVAARLLAAAVQMPNFSTRAVLHLESSVSQIRAAHHAGQGQQPVSGLELARVIATARITMPRSVVRLSAGRLNFSFADQARAASPSAVWLRLLCEPGLTLPAPLSVYNMARHHRPNVLRRSWLTSSVMTRWEALDAGTVLPCGRQQHL